MKICFVGVGSIAKRHIGNLTEIFAERGEPLQIDVFRRSAARELPDGVTAVYTSAEALPKDYDVMFLTNPTEYHADMLIALHEHARHFFIEKPVASLGTADKLRGFPFREDAVYYVACPLRYHRVIQHLKQTLDPKSVNAVRSISSSYLPDWRPGTDYRQTYSAQRKLGGGVGIDLIHEWDYLSFLFGLPQEVKSFSGKVSGLEIDSDDYAIYIARYDGMVAELHLDYFGRKTIRRVEIFTEDETIVGDLTAGTVSYLKEGRTLDLTEDRNAYQKRELLHFLDMTAGRVRSDNDVEHAVRVLKLTQGQLEEEQA